jgi:type II secretory pathway component PulF
MISSPPHPQPDPLLLIGHFMLLVLLYLVILLPVGGILYLLYHQLTLPMRRNERARLFLDLLELGLNEGRTPERAVLDAAASRDPAPGARFHLLAAQLEQGARFGEALARVPRLLPPQITAMLQAGERTGDLRRVLPACRQRLNDGVSQVRGALNYLPILTFLITPSTIVVPMFLTVFVLPKFKEVFAGMSGNAMLPPFTRFIFDHTREIFWGQALILVLIWMVMLAYLFGPRFHRCMQRLLPGVPDRILYRLPWRRKRLHRDFSTMLAVLLDSGMPELEAVTLAAESTTHAVIRRRAAQACARLKSGVALPSAILSLDDGGELSWRLANALHRGRDFLRALAGWHEALDAKAFQLEQSAAQLTTSALVLFNGAVVGGVVIAVFLALVHLTNQVALW